MKRVILLCLLFETFVFVSGCKDAKTGIVIPEQVEKYPTTLNSEWEYETASYVAKYDKNGNIGNDSLAWPISYSVVRITSVNDSIYGEKNLLRFDFGSNLEYSTGTHWYRNNDNALEMVAYSGMERNWVTPKIKKTSPLLFLKYLSTRVMPETVLPLINDSIYFLKKNVLEYPLTVGKIWEIFLPDGLRINRTILGKSQFVYRETNTECFDIKSTYYRSNELDTQTDEHDYISLEYGLLKRETIIDSIPKTTVENPYGTGEFYRYKLTSILIRKSN